MSALSNEPAINKSSARRGLVLLRADASPTTGYGHLVRSLSLASYLNDILDVRLYSWNSDPNKPKWIEQQCANDNLKLIWLSSPTREAADQAFLDILKGHPGAVAVLDNYYHTSEYMEAVRSTAKALVSIDDMPTRHFPSDVLISFCPYPREAYDMAPHTRYLSGFQYSFLRKPFLAPQSKRQRRGIAIAMGGADPLSLTAVLLPKVRERFPEEAIEVIAGNAVKLPSKMDMMPRVIVHRQVSAQEIADIFDRCRFGIFPASTICMEALSRGLPIAAGYFVDNQMEVYRSGVVSGLFHPLGDLRELIAFPPLEFSASPTLPDFAETRNEIRALFLELAL